MGWAVGWDNTLHYRWIGYGVPCKCEHPDCDKDIDRGMAYACGGGPTMGAYQDNCGLFFCGEHLTHFWEDPDGDGGEFICERCGEGQEPWDPKPDTEEWATHLLTDESWAQWRRENPGQLEQYYAIVAK
jgi:hypothetical protein